MGKKRGTREMLEKAKRTHTGRHSMSDIYNKHVPDIVQ